MKYVFYWKIKEPWDKNYKKTMEIQEKRIKSGENWGDEMIFPIHSYMTENKAFMIVETDDEAKVAKWAADYSSVFDYKIEPVMEWTKIQKLFT